MEQELISGTVASVVFQNQLNGYAVIRLQSEDGTMITVVGVIPSVVVGERLIITGKWTSHASYGKQFEAEFLERLLPDSRADILAYLSSRAVRGVGPKTAEKIVERFGEDALKILDLNPERLAEIPGISHNKALEIGASFRMQIGVRRLIEFLSSFRIPAEAAVRFYRIYGEQASELLHENPYRIALPQFGAPFSATDAMALELGFRGDDPRRIEAALVFELRHNLRNGHAFLPMDKLILATSDMLDQGPSLIYEALERLCEIEEVSIDHIGEIAAVYLPNYHEAEAYIADRVMQMTEARNESPAFLERIIDGMEENLGISFAALQREAIAGAATHRLMILTGGPGTGKTTTLSAILGVFQAMGRKTMLAAPTGRAAKRLSELTGYEASTIHRLLETQISPDTGEMYFIHDEEDPLDCDALIVDEMSMVDVTLMHSLLRALPEKTTMILVGDPDQLPSVGAGNLFSDLIRSGRVKTVCLTEIFRQAQESLIVMNAHAVNRGELPILNITDRDFFFMKRKTAQSLVQTVSELCAKRLPEKMGIPSEDIQVISPTRKGETGTVFLNRALQEALNPPAPTKAERICGETCFREGDRVMQIRNNYDIFWKRADGTAGTGIFNGDIGIIQQIDRREEQVRILFDDKEVLYDMDMLPELELAYAITAHKSQGSEYRGVIFVPFAGTPMLLTRGVLYTAMTRARELLIMVGNEEVVAQMTMNNKRNKRYSGLKYRLVHYYDNE